MKLLTLSVLLFCSIVFQTVAGNAIYKSNFGTKGITGRNINGQRQVVAVTDLPKVKHALQMTTITKDGKHYAPAWNSSKLKIDSQGKITVDYYVKQLSVTGRYGIFVSSGKKQLVAVIFSLGKILFFDKKQWQPAKSYKLNKWYHIRYIISTESKTYDLYIDDMTEPAARDIGFRDLSAGLPTRVWLPGASLKGAKSEYAEIKVTYKKSEDFPSAQLMKYPFYLIGLGHKNIVVEPTNSDDMPVIESSKFIVSCNESGLLFDFDGKGKYKTNYLKKSKPWQNDCIEIFIDPGKTRRKYYHFAVDCFGQRYQAACSLKGSNSSWKGKWESKITYTSNGWKCKVFIPYTTLGAVLMPGDIWGLNIGRENSRTKEITSWVNLNNFHQVDRFGNLILLKQGGDKNSAKKYETSIAKKIYNIQKLQKSIKEKSAVLSKFKLTDGSNKTLLNLKQQEDAIIKSYYNSDSYYNYYKQYLTMKELLREYNSFVIQQKRAANLFKSGSTEAKTGFVVFPESSMEKIMPLSYVGSNLKNIKLNLAKNEYGSFQLAILSKPGKTIEKLQISFYDLFGTSGAVIGKNNLTSYLLKNIKTALPGKEQVEIPDVLIPGNEFKIIKPQNVSALWCDIYIPENTKAGLYEGEIKLTINGDISEIINYQIEVYPFALPKSISLKNLFCFVPKWVEKYYRTKIPQDKRISYFTFLLKHRINPVNLWANRNQPLLNEKELKYTMSKGNNLITLPMRADKLSKYIDMLKRNNWVDKAVFFGADEIQSFPSAIPAMKKEFTKIKKLYPNIPRLCTASIDQRLFGVVDIWCPRFHQKHFQEKLEAGRRRLGEKLWWYLTDYPDKPYANLNLNSPGIDPRIIPWMTWKVGAEGLLYWAINREWKTNGGEQILLSDNDILTRSLEWLTPECKKSITKGKRWPEVPWIPVFISVATKRASATNGAGNLMYPGPDWQPYPSTRLKNLRDGIQDYEYLVILKKLLDNKLSMPLRKEIETSIKIDKKVIASATRYTKKPADILKEKQKLATLIIKAQKEVNQKCK